jgi:hypothetical protein
MFDFSNHEIDKKVLDSVLESYRVQSKSYEESGIFFDGDFCPLSELQFRYGDLMLET